MGGHSQRVGSRRQVWNGTAMETSGGLKRSDLFKDKYGNLKSRKASKKAKRSKNLKKAGYTAVKGKFGAVRISGKPVKSRKASKKRKSSKKSRKAKRSSKKRGGYHHAHPRSRKVGGVHHAHPRRRKINQMGGQSAADLSSAITAIQAVTNAGAGGYTEQQWIDAQAAIEGIPEEGETGYDAAIDRTDFNTAVTAFEGTARSDASDYVAPSGTPASAAFVPPGTRTMEGRAGSAEAQNTFSYPEGDGVAVTVTGLGAEAGQLNLDSVNGAYDISDTSITEGVAGGRQTGQTSVYETNGFAAASEFEVREGTGGDPDDPANYSTSARMVATPNNPTPGALGVAAP